MRYRLTDLPLSFRLWGADWRIEAFEVLQAGGAWRCDCVGPVRYTLCAGGSASGVRTAVVGEGIEVRGRTVLASVFRHLERSGMAARVDP